MNSFSDQNLEARGYNSVGKPGWNLKWQYNLLKKDGLKCNLKGLAVTN